MVLEIKFNISEDKYSLEDHLRKGDGTNVGARSLWHAIPTQ